MTRQPFAMMAATALVLWVSACGGGSNDTPSSPTPDPGTGGAATIAITSSGVSPSSVTVSPGSRVTFVNNDTRNHDMASDPHPVHTDCPEINQVANLTPGQSRTTGNLNTVRTCGFHDHNLPDVRSLQGSIRIQ